MGVQTRASVNGLLNFLLAYLIFNSVFLLQPLEGDNFSWNKGSLVSFPAGEFSHELDHRQCLVWPSEDLLI